MKSARGFYAPPPLAARMSKFVISKDNKGEWRWKFVAANGETIASSSEGYTRKATCERSIEIIKTNGPAAVVVEQ